MHFIVSPSSSWSVREQEIWDICSVCWDWDPSKRLQMHQIALYLERISQVSIDDDDYNEAQATSGASSIATRQIIPPVSGIDVTLSKENVSFSSSEYAVNGDNVMNRPTRWNDRDKHACLLVSEDGRTLVFHGMPCHQWDSRAYNSNTSSQPQSA